MIIKCCFDFGMKAFHDINASVAVYTVFQIVIVSAAFGYIVSTLRLLGASSKAVIISSLFYFAMPYHIAYSITMWKDVLFGVTIAVFIASLIREIRKAGNEWGDHLIFVISGIGFGILRSNGLFALVIVFLAMLVILRKENLKLLFVTLCVIFVAFLMKYPLLSALNVSQPDIAEALSIPEQQIARLVVEDAEFTEEQYELIQKAVNVDELKAEYQNWISDPVKNNMRRVGLEYFNSHRREYLLLWAQLGSKYPLQYLESWVDQTKGYWNGGYDRFVWINEVQSNDLGIVRKSYAPFLATAFNIYLRLFYYFPFLEPVRCIGVHTWIVLVLVYLCIVEKRKEALLIIPILAIIASLMISTPVYSEFRYVCSMFTSLPMLIYVVFSKRPRFSEGDAV